MKIRGYHEAAEEELLNAVGYLELQTAGLGRRFFTEVERAEAYLTHFPDAAQEILPGIRRLPLRKFQYSLNSLDQDCLLILAVAHNRRRPDYWSDRLP